MVGLEGGGGQGASYPSFKKRNYQKCPKHFVHTLREDNRISYPRLKHHKQWAIILCQAK